MAHILKEKLEIQRERERERERERGKEQYVHTQMGQRDGLSTNLPK